VRSTSDPRPGRYIEAYTKSRTRDAITSLAKLKPAEAFVVGLADEKRLLSSFPSEDHDIENGDTDTDTAAQIAKPGSKVQKVPADLLEVGDVIRVPKGATPAIDGIVVSGPSLFDESAVTGESKPITKGSGDHVLLGTINIGQAVDVRIDVAEGKTMSVSSLMSNHACNSHPGIGLIMSSK
jgi:P-type Cu+ transporter